MAITALEQILEWGVEEIQSSIKLLTDIISSNINIDKFKRAGHIISIPISGSNVNAVKQKFLQNKIIVSFRGSFVRISPHLYNDHSDINRLIECLS